MDKILITGIPLACRVGVPPEEREREQEILVDVELSADLRPAAASDNVERAVNYEQVYHLVAEVAGQQPYALIETVAETMANRILDRFPVHRVLVRLKKPRALACWRVSYAGVEIVRERNA